MSEDSTKEILSAYRVHNSVKSISIKTGYSWQRIVKTLSTNGIVLNDLHRNILEMRDNGVSVEEIANTLNISKRTVCAYIPRVRPVYGENLSDNAKRVRKCREKKQR